MGGPRLGSPFPTPTPPRDDRETAAIEFVQEQVPGEVELDAVVRAQASAPQVVARMVALENCVWSLASLLLSLPAETREKIGARAPLEAAQALLLKSIVLDHNLALPEAERPAEAGHDPNNTLFP
ncbi:MAG: hypothetical protein WBQ34_06975 [Candidatus Acidiferrales bacterium]